MNLPLWVRVLLWFAGASLRDLLEPSKPLPVLPPPPPELRRKFLATRLRVVNALFAAHLGGAHISRDGIPCRCHRPERWPN